MKSLDRAPNDKAPRMFLTSPQGVWTITIGVVVGLASFPYWRGVSPWGGCIAMLMVLVALHMPYASRLVVPFPHIAIVICTLQYGLAPWAAHYIPAQNAEYHIKEFAQYFAYAGPVTLAIALGWVLSCVRLHLSERTASGSRINPALVRDLHLMFWGGILLKVALGSTGLGGLAFFFLLLANLRFISVMGLMILGAPGWRWRLALVMFLEIVTSAGSGMFHEFVLWSLGLFAVYAFTRRPAVVMFLGWLAVIGVGVFLLNDAKWQLREAIWGGSEEVVVFGKNIEVTSWNRPLVAGLCLVQSGTKAFAGGYSRESLGDMVMRFNQGWIIERILQHVPDEEPFAHGETVISAFKAALLPRVFAPNKPIAGGKLFMERFAGYTLTEDTSMNLGFAGEMYANFGYRGGIVGCGVYALILGLLFRWVTVRAQTSPLWWAIAVYVGHWALKAETDIGTVLNYLVKAGFVVFVVVMCLPALRAELTGRALPARKLSKRVRHAKVKPAGAGQVPPLTTDL